jgi:predicted metal-dependent HD superfamily phosphohydrolase
MDVNTSDLRARFLQALSEAGAQRPGNELFAELLARYGQAHRHYHTVLHIDACLGFFDWYRGLAQHPERVELALWFHDAVYDPRLPDNERQSALLARTRLGDLGLPSVAIDAVETHVLATERHACGLADTNLMIDLDLSILAAPARRFERFEQEVREEYAHVPTSAFLKARRSVLSGFLARPEIYRVRALHDELETRARRNLERRILELEELIRGNRLPR